jgi:hypothetical protein
VGDGGGRLDLDYLPPWRDVLPSGELGPEFGPRVLSEYERLLTEHEQSTAGGGLWDPHEAARVSPARRRVRRITMTRPDAEEMSAWMRSRSHTIPARELEVYSAYWVDGLSIAVTARRLRMQASTVAGIVSRLRARVRAHASRDLQAA